MTTFPIAAATLGDHRSSSSFEAPPLPGHDGIWWMVIQHSAVILPPLLLLRTVATSNNKRVLSTALTTWFNYPYQFAFAVPHAAALAVLGLLLMAWLSPVGLAVFALTAMVGAGFSAPQSHLPPKLLSGRHVRPANHNPNAVKVPTPLVSTRDGDSYYFAGQSFSRSILVMLVQNRFKLADLLAVIIAGLFITYAAAPLGTSSVKLFFDLIVGNFATYLWLNSIHWLKSVRPRPGQTHTDARRRGLEGKPFLLSVLSIVRNPHNPDGRIWVPKAPFSSEEESCQRGLTTIGMDYGAFLFDLLTWAIEYKIQALGRIAKYDLGLAPGPALTSHNVYLALINTCFACWLDTATSQVTFYDTLLPHNSVDLKLWAKITIDVDMVNQTVGQLTMEPYNNGGESVEVLTTSNLPEICAVIHILWGFKTHPNVHFWANSVQEITTDEWKLSTTSHNTTQGFNNGAVFSTAEVMGHSTSPQWFGICTSHAVRSGLPVHTAVKVIAHQSTAHLMVTEARANLAEIRPDMSRMKREAIIQATVMHALDHHYMPKFLPACANSELLNTSTQMVLSILSRPFEYKCRRSLMMKHHVDSDDICAALYKACANHDRQFADECLTVGVLV